MAENEFEKTVKINVNPPAPQAKPAIDKTSQFGAGVDRTVKINPAEEKTAKFTVPAQPHAAAQMPTPPHQPSQQYTPVQPAPPPMPFTEQGVEKSNGGKIAVLSLLIAGLLLGGAWHFLPGWLKTNAEKLSKAGNHGGAVKKLKTALALYPLKKEPYLLLLGQEQRLAKDLSGAQRSFAQVLMKNPNSPVALRELGLAQYEAGFKDKAFETLQKYSGMKPNDMEVTRTIANLAFDIKNFSESASAYEKITQSGNATAEDWRWLGLSYMQTGKQEQAIKALLTAVDKDKSIKGVYSTVGNLYASKGLYAEAAGTYGKELAMSMNDAQLAETYAEMCWKAGNDVPKNKLAEAAQYWKQGSLVESKYKGQFLYKLAVFYAKNKKKGDAFENLKEAIKTNASFKRQAKKEPLFAQFRKSKDFQKIVR